MSLVIKFGVIQPPEPKELKLLRTPDMFIFTMNKAFGNFPCDLDKSHIERLSGMAACYPEPNEYTELIIQIKRWHQIRVWSDSDAKTAGE